MTISKQWNALEDANLTRKHAAMNVENQLSQEIETITSMDIVDNSPFEFKNAEPIKIPVD
ncbi:hypothetical protein BGZ79_003610, partial [Entomortierella chlamydospora]